MAARRRTLISNFILKLPRATSTFSRLPAIRSPLAPSFVRFQSNGGEEKVKGQVIGIDLGALDLQRQYLANG